MFLEQINKRLDALKDKMDAQADTTKYATRRAAKKVADTAKTAVVAGAKTIGIKVEPRLYARIHSYKESRGITSMKKAVVSLCEKALDNLKIY